MLIDTHILLWVFEGINGRMGQQTTDLITGKSQDYTVSAASFIEIKVKQRKNGLMQFSLPNLVSAVQSKNIPILDIQPKHIYGMPLREITPHADPFDLLLMAQAITEGLPFLTCDETILSVAQPGLRLIDGRL